MDPKDFKQSVPRAIERYKNVWNSVENNRDIRERNVTLHTKNASFTEISVRCRYCSNSSTREHIVYVSHTWSHTWLRGGLRWGVDQSKRTLFLAFPHVTTRRLICIKFDNSSTSIEWYYGLRKPLPTIRRFFIHFPFKFAVDTDPLIKKKKNSKNSSDEWKSKNKSRHLDGGPKRCRSFLNSKKKKKKKKSGDKLSRNWIRAAGRFHFSSSQPPTRRINEKRPPPHRWAESTSRHHGNGPI